MTGFVWDTYTILSIRSQAEFEKLLPNCNLASSIAFTHLATILESSTKSKPFFGKHPVKKSIDTFLQALPSIIKICERDGLFKRKPLPPGDTVRYCRTAPLSADYEPLFEAILHKQAMLTPAMTPLFLLYKDLRENGLILDVFWKLKF